MDDGEGALEERGGEHDAGTRLPLHRGGNLVELLSHGLETLHVVTRRLVVADDVRGLHEARELHLDAEHRAHGIELVPLQPGEAPEGEASLVLVDENVVGDLVLAAQGGAIEAADFREELAELRVFLVALAQRVRGELVGVVIEDRAVGETDGGKHLGVAHQELERLAVRQDVEGEGLAPHDTVAGVAERRHENERDPPCNRQALLHPSTPGGPQHRSGNRADRTFRVKPDRARREGRSAL